MNESLKLSCEGALQEMIDMRTKWMQDAQNAQQVIDLIDALPELPDGYKFTDFGDRYIQIAYPYDKIFREKFHQYMIEHGWEMLDEVREEKITNSYSHPSRNYINKNLPEISGWYFQLRVQYNDGMEGSTCHRKKIGEEMRMCPVYEYACSGDTQE